MFLSLLAPLALSRQSNGVIFQEPAAPLSRVMPALATACHLPLEVSTALKSDVVCIDVHDVTAKTLLEKLAWATCGAWKQSESGTFTLVVSDGLRSVQARDELKRKADLIYKDLNPPKTPDEQGSSADMLDQVSLFDGLDSKPLLRKLDPMVIAAIPDGTRLVFSTRPNRMQVAFPFDVTETANSILAGFNKAVTAQAQSSDNPEQGMFGRQPQKPLVGRIGKVLLVVTNEYGYDSIHTRGQLHLFDQAGKEMRPDSSGFGFSGDSWEQGADTSKPVEIPHEARLFARFAMQRAEGTVTSFGEEFDGPDRAVKPLAPEAFQEAKERFLSPEAVDPLVYPAGLLRGLAKAEGDQLVCCLPDPFVASTSGIANGLLTAKAVKYRLTQNRYVDVREAGGWLLGRPRDPAKAESERLDRHELGRVLGMLSTRDWLGASETEMLARIGYGLEEGSLVQLWCTVARPTYFQAGFDQDWDMMRFYLGLSEAQKSALDRQGSTDLAPMMPEQVAALYRLIFCEQDGGFMGHGERLTLMSPGAEWFGDSEPTELLPNGVPQSVTLSLDTETTAVLQAAVDKHSREGRLLGSDPVDDNEVTQYLTEAAVGAQNTDATEHFGDRFYKGVPSQMKVGKRKGLSLTVHFGPRLQADGRFHVDDMTNPQTVAFATIKARLKEEVDRQIKMRTEMEAEQKKRQGVGGGQPPG